MSYIGKRENYGKLATGYDGIRGYTK